jgi:hypothetical protein
MNRERGQALVEALVAIPACIACALMVADCGVLVRDRIAVTQAATRAAEAQLTGADATRAARGALPASLRASLRVDVDDDRVIVHADSGSRIAQLAGRTVTHRSSVEVAR